jgi:hypothetical protein
MIGGEVGWAGASPTVSPTADLYDPTGSFQPTGSMAVARESHTATLLRDGRVLVAGGARPKGISWEALPFAEIYDPGTGTFSATSNMNEARYAHTATLLADGRVLITGGWNTGNLTTAGDTPLLMGRNLASAEIYDPVTASFTLTGSMSFERSFHTATLLLDGQVLVTGYPAIAEVYDPATGSFQSVGAMATPRTFHTATLLTNGTVLVVGGFAQSGALSSAELYDPAAGSFTRTADLNAGRLWHTATLLSDGSVLVIGGAGTMSDLKLEFVDSAEIYK